MDTVREMEDSQRGPYGSRDPKWNQVSDEDLELLSKDPISWKELMLIRGEQATRKPPIIPQRSKLLWVGVDLDGTLAEPLWTPENPTSEIGDLIPESLDKVIELVHAGYKIIIHTSRPWTDYEAIENWLRHYQVPFKEIQCGKPLYAAYIDDRAINATEHSWLPDGN